MKIEQSIRNAVGGIPGEILLNPTPEGIDRLGREIRWIAYMRGEKRFLFVWDAHDYTHTDVLRREGIDEYTESVLHGYAKKSKDVWRAYALSNPFVSSDERWRWVNSRIKIRREWE
jgi:hypothetical protein